MPSAGVRHRRPGDAPSARGELEITDLNLRYVREGRARLVDLGPGSVWFDTGTDGSLLDAARFVQLLEKQRGVRVSCPEEVAYRMGFIDAAQLRARGGVGRGVRVRPVSPADRGRVGTRRTVSTAQSVPPRRPPVTPVLCAGPGCDNHGPSSRMGAHGCWSGTR
ncbi:hypothetical protein [Streptodolium elevatio]